MKKNYPLISIILNCYNGEKFLKDTLDSVCNQTYKNWELIFWDNISTDKSKEILHSYKNIKFKYFKSKKHTSLYKARNLAIKKARGKFIAFIDADDIWVKNKLSLQMKLFSKKNVVLVYGNSFIQKESNKKKKIFISKKIKRGYIFNDLIKNYNIGILTAVINKSLLKKKEFQFNDRYNIIGDYDLFIRLSKNFAFDAVQKPVAVYRIHENNFSLQKKKLQILELKHWIKQNKKLLGNYNQKLINKKIVHLEFLQKKLDENFFKTFVFFFNFKKVLLNIKNLFILFTPVVILKKIMWFS